MEHVIQHFRKEEQPFIEKVIGWQREVEDRFSPKLCDFLDPRERFIVHSIIGQSGELLVKSEGGFLEAERQRLLIYPNYFEPTFEDYQITICSIHYPSKFIQLKHPDVLGALLSIGLGRSKFGDIHIDGETIQFAVAKEVEEYVKVNLTSIGKAKVRVESIKDASNLIQMVEEWVDKSYTVASMRLDVILATVMNLSRQKSQALILAGKVKVNWSVREDTSFEIQEGDIISARGFGRLKVLMTEGRTKKDKIRLQIGRLEQK
ncbi:MULTISPECIES: RNA-binding protein [Lysinibacillus]|uniref:RNA-binding protein n=1 Tax=Lysinibacillus antri TaxID=2498145 RepID=A0A3S0WI65_9BACI|nr:MULTISPECIES: RNA-binding protein [Lysinibacillus]RUL55891.1 RNA-binding protein [Lysinibacillus antri]TSI11494.1 RNA-binding protein [Lysinibacillus sp. BW-2-10]